MAERITGHTELIGLIATPIRHSMSPTMHNEAFAHLGLDYVYLAFEVGNQELKDVVQGFRAMKCCAALTSLCRTKPRFASISINCRRRHSWSGRSIPWSTTTAY